MNEIHDKAPNPFYSSQEKKKKKKRASPRKASPAYRCCPEHCPATRGLSTSNRPAYKFETGALAGHTTDPCRLLLRHNGILPTNRAPVVSVGREAVSGVPFASTRSRRLFPRPDLFAAHVIRRNLRLTSSATPLPPRAFELPGRRRSHNQQQASTELFVNKQLLRMIVIYD